MIRQQLQRRYVQDRRQQAIVFRQANHVQAITRGDARIDVGEHVQLAATRTHFLHVRLQLFQQRIVRRDRYYRHLFGHQRQRAVLQFAGRVGLGVDVRDFLELQRAFQGDRVVDAAPQEQGVLFTREFLGPGDDLRLERQHRRQRDRQVTHHLEVFGFLGIGQAAVDLRQGQGQEEQRRQLGGEGLGRGHADFDAGAGDVGQLALAHHSAGRDVADGQRMVHAEAARVLERGQGVGRLAALRDGHHQGVGVRHAVAVAVFAGDLDVHRHLGHRLDPVLGGEAGVVAGAAGQDQHAVDLLEHGIGAVAEQFRHHAGHALERVADDARLLEDLFLHVVAVRAELGRAGMGVHGFHFALDRTAVDVDDPVAGQLQVDHVAFFQIDDLVSGAGQRHRVGGDEVLVLADADDQRRALARGDHAVRFFAAEHGDRVGAVQALDGLLHGLEQVAGVQVVDQVGDDLGVGLARELVAQAGQFGAQLVVVFDDAVVDKCNARIVFGRREVRVGIVRRRGAVGGPAGVGDAGEAVEACLFDLRFEVGHARGGARAGQAAIEVDGDAAGIVPAVFEPFQALDQDGGDITLGDCTDDTAHG